MYLVVSIYKTAIILSGVLPQSPGPYLIGISHFLIQVDSGCECPLSLSFLSSAQRWGVAPV